MNKNELNILKILAVIAAIGTITYLALKNYWIGKENKYQKGKIDDLERKNIEILQSSLIDRKKIPDEIQKHLKELSEDIKENYPDIAKELNSALNIYSSGEKEKSIGTIYICIENLLKAKYEDDIEFKKWNKTEKNNDYENPSKDGLIEFAHKNEIISEVEFKLASELRKLRNKTFHEAGFKLETLFGKGYLMMSLGITIKLSKSLA